MGSFLVSEVRLLSGYHKNGETGIHLPIEETRKRDEEIEVAFLDFVQNTYCK